MNLFDVINIYCKASLPNLYFLRQTNNPQRDIERDFSGYAGTWVKTKEEALERQSFNPGMWLSPPRQDPYTKLWCYDPELGLSGWGFFDEETFKIAKQHMKRYLAGDKIGVFSSNDYDENAGADGEDVFRNAKFLFYIDIATPYKEFIKLLNPSF